MPRLTQADIAVFDIEGLTLLGDLRKASVELDAAWALATPVSSFGTVREPVRQGVAIEGKLTSTWVSGAKVSALDLSDLQIGGSALGAWVKGGRFEGRNRTEESAGVSDAWRFPAVVEKDYRAVVRVAVDAACPRSVAESAFGALAAKKVTFSVSIGSVTVSLPMAIESFRHTLDAGSVQEWEIRLAGRAVDSSYPDGPVGTGTLLAWAFQAPQVPLGIEVVSHATAGIGVSGQFLVEKFGFGFDAGTVIESEYRFVSVGEVQAVVA